MKPVTAGTCEQCGYTFDSAARVGSDRYKQPEIDSLGICVNCGDIHKFTVDGPHSLSSEEWVFAMQSPNVRKAVAAVRMVNDNRQHKHH